MLFIFSFFFFFFNDTATTEIYTLSLHDALPISLVAGNLVAREQKIKSRAGRDHLLQVFVRPGDLEKTEHAMNSLMASVAWDEARFGLSLDLDRFMIVATSDFNMGAMEHKGLNVFNTKSVLASQSTATDTDYANIESVVGHEYFHNWTGNRVTCRDWFQLSLKEGLTDRKSTRLNSSHQIISYAVFCLKKKIRSAPGCRVALSA